MSKYDDVYNYHKEELPLMADEEVLWSGKPKKAAYLFGQSVQGITIAIIWLIADLTIILEIAREIQGDSPVWMAIIPFFFFHLIPVWVWVKQIITATRKWKNTFYYVTNKRILISDGFFAENYHTIYYKDIQGVNLHIGILDKLFKTGDVFLELNHSISVGTRVGTTTSVTKGGFLDISDYMKVYKLIQKTVLDIQSDIQYPNAYRPDYNPGYNTKYRNE